MPAITARAIGKTILFGEHAVVYGFPAIAFPIRSIQVKVIIQPSIRNDESIIQIRNPGWTEDSKYSALPHENPIYSSLESLKKTFDSPLPAFIMTISSTIPISAGLGSSASVAVAVIRGMSEFMGFSLEKKMISEIAFQSEIIQHGTPSGIDNSVVTYEKPVFFQKDQPINPIYLSEDIYLVLADSGERTATRDVVHMVKENREHAREKFDSILNQIGTITKNAKEALRAGSIQDVGKLMSENHQALRKLEVSTNKLDALVKTAEKAGAFGAKLCGGGKGGFIVSLCNHENMEHVASHLSKFSQRVIQTQIEKSIT